MDSKILIVMTLEEVQPGLIWVPLMIILIPLFVKTIQDRQGTFVNSPHEIAFRNKFIGKEEIENLYTVTKIQNTLMV